MNSVFFPVPQAGDNNQGYPAKLGCLSEICFFCRFLSVWLCLYTINQQKEKVVERSNEEKKVFAPRIEVFSPFKRPFCVENDKVVSADAEKAAACCACTACTACR